MAQRKRSHDMSRDTDKLIDPSAPVSQQGRAGGTLQRDIATQDERKRATERPAGQTRVTKSDEREGGDA